MKGSILLNFKGKKGLVIGTGKVGSRRAETLAGYGCFVICVSPDAPPVESENPYIKRLKTYYETTLLEGIDLVVAATDDKKTNAKILEDCRMRRIWCNVADDPEASDFIFPSVVQRGDLTLSVCTDGASPFLATQIKKELEEKYDEHYVKRLEYLKILRKRVLRSEELEKEKRIQLKEMAGWTLDKLQEEVVRV